MKNWETTIFGVLALIIAICVLAMHALPDAFAGKWLNALSDAQKDWPAVAVALTGLGLVRAADAKKLAASVAKTAPAILLGLLVVGHAWAAPVSEFDVAKRLNATMNAGGIVVTGASSWSGASVGGTVLYNLHPSLSLFGGYDHGFPIKSTAEHLDLFRAVASLRVLPDAFVGFGYAWFDGRSDGALAQLVLTKEVMPRVAVGGMYAHVMTRTSDPDFEYVRAYVNYHLFGKE